MIIFGTRGKSVAGPRRQGIVCSVCGKDEHATYGVLRYFHVFFVPFFPTAKQPVLECLHCKKTLVGKEIPERVRTEIAPLVFTRGRVLPLFTGLALACFFALSAGVVGRAESAKQAAYLQAPAPGDFYVVKLSDILENADAKHPYGVLKAASVGGGEVELRVGTYGYASVYGAQRAVSDKATVGADYFGEKGMAIPVEELRRLKDKGTIHSVTRL